MYTHLVLTEKLWKHLEEVDMECNDMMDMLTVRMAAVSYTHLDVYKRQEPSHALALALKKEQVRYTADLASDGEVIRGYLNGGTFSYRCV